MLCVYPAGQDDFRPAVKSRTAKELGWTFVIGENIAVAAAAGKLDFSQPMPPVPAGPIGDVIAAYQKSHRDAVARVQALGDVDFSRPTAFPVGPRSMAERRLADVL